MQIGVFLRRGGFEPQFAGFRRRFGGSEPRERQRIRRISGQIRREIIHEVWGAVLVALHKPPETAPFIYSLVGTLGEALRPMVLEGDAEIKMKIN